MKTKALAIAGAAVAGVVAAGVGVVVLLKRKSTAAASALPTRAPTTPGFQNTGVAPPGGNDVLSTITGVAAAATAVTGALGSISKQFGLNF